MLLWWQPNNPAGTLLSHRGVSIPRGNEASAKLYRFVVVKGDPNDQIPNRGYCKGYSMCL